MGAQPELVLRNGVVIPPHEAAISVFNPAIYGAYGVYESIQVVNGVVFEMQAHLERLAHSARVIELPLPASLNTIAAWIGAAVAHHGRSDCTVRLFVIGPDAAGAACAYIWTQPPTSYPESFYTRGATAITFEAQRYLPESKSLNTLTSFMAQRRARSAGAHEALLHHNGHLTEGSNSNLFAVIEGQLLTPPGAEVLAGVTRDVVMRLAREDGVPLRLAALPLGELPRWQECFITSTSRHIMPIATIDGEPVGEGRPGPITKRLAELFEAYFEQRTSVG